MTPSILQRYVLRELLHVALLSIVALCAMLLVGMSVSLVRAGLNIIHLRGVILYVITFSLPYALPCSFLVSAVFVFGRLSGHNEIAAMRATGVNVNHVIFPCVAAAAVACVLHFGLNQYLLPWSLRNVRASRNRLLSQVLTKRAMRAPKEFMIGNYVLYYDGLDEERNLWKNMAVIKFEGEVPVQIAVADLGRCSVDEDLSKANLVLYGAQVFQPRIGELEEEPSARFERLTLILDLEQEGRLSSDRPKYLSLPALLRARRTLGAEAVGIRARPEYAEMTRPKARRKLAERERNQAFRKRDRAKYELSARARAVKQARRSVRDTERELREPAAARDAALARLQETEGQLMVLKQRHDRMAAEVARTPVGKSTRARIRRLKKERDALAAQMKEVSARAKAAEDEAELQDGEVRRIEKRVRAARRRLVKVEERVRQGRDAVREASGEYNRLWDHVANLHTLERLLRVEAAVHFRNAGSLTSLMFLLMGIPLGILSRRGNVVLAFAISFFAVLMIYYPLMVVAEMLSEDAYMPAWIAQWTPNAAVGGMGLILMKWGIRR